MDTMETVLQADMDAKIHKRYQHIGRKIAYYRRLRGHTQVQLAERIGISSNYLSQIECGKRKRFPLHTLIVIAEALGVELKELCE